MDKRTEGRVTVTCTGRAMKVCETQAEAEAYVAMQKRKLRGAGLSDKPITDTKQMSHAAQLTWAIRATQYGDFDSMTNSDHAPLKTGAR